MKDRERKNNGIFASVNAVVDGEDLWMLSIDTDVLLHFDFKSLKLLDYYIIPGETYRRYAHLLLRKAGNIIYVTPGEENSLICFDCVSKKIENIHIPLETDEIWKGNQFNFAAVWQSRLILSGYLGQGIFFYDMTHGSFTRDVGYLGAFKKLGCDLSALQVSYSYCQRKNKLYIPILFTNLILEIDMETCMNHIYELRYGKELQLRTIDEYGQDDKFLLTTADDEMLIWSPINGVERLRPLGLLHAQNKMYAQAFHVREKNYYIAAYERRVFVEKDERIRELKFENKDRGRVQEDSSQFEAIFKNKTDIYFQVRSNGQLFKIDTEIDMICQMDFDVTMEKKKEITDEVCRYRSKFDMSVESAWFDLDIFLKCYVCKQKI